MSALDLTVHPHRRLNALTGEWVLVSPHRTARPWQGQVDTIVETRVGEHDPTCYMCPGNTRANGERNPSYTSTFAFTNDFPALTTGTPQQQVDVGGLLIAEGERGVCRVVCFSPRHDLTLSQMTRKDIRRVVDLWTNERAELAGHDGIRYVQIFENRGAVMGASNPHPHGQIWASSSVPSEVLKEDARLRSHAERFGQDLLGDYLDLEVADGVRLVCDNASFVAVVPYWAVWPFETMILPRRLIPALDGFTSEERDGLADILKRVLTRCDNLFETPFSYSMGFHESPVDGQPHPGWRWHAHIYPPLLRSATVRKFMVGYEMLASPQRDMTPEAAAERLRAATEK